MIVVGRLYLDFTSARPSSISVDGYSYLFRDFAIRAGNILPKGGQQANTSLGMIIEVSMFESEV